MGIYPILFLFEYKNSSQHIKHVEYFIRRNLTYRRSKDVITERYFDVLKDVRMRRVRVEMEPPTFTQEGHKADEVW